MRDCIAKKEQSHLYVIKSRWISVKLYGVKKLLPRASFVTKDARGSSFVPHITEQIWLIKECAS